MNENTEHRLSEADKLLTALGAAMGAGCRKCAENLQRMGREQGITEADMMRACRIGLDAKAEAIKTMKAKVSELFKNADKTDGITPGENADRLASLIRASAFAAANSAPDVIEEIRKASARGVPASYFTLCFSIANLVRSKAMAFSDEEVSKQSRCRETESGDQSRELSGPRSASRPNTCGCS